MLLACRAPRGLLLNVLFVPAFRGEKLEQRFQVDLRVSVPWLLSALAFYSREPADLVVGCDQKKTRTDQGMVDKQ